MNIIDYTKKNAYVTFEEMPFNEVDALILCQMTYLNFPRLKMDFPFKFKDITAKENFSDILLSKRELYPLDYDLVPEVLKSNRFNELEIVDCVEYFNREEECQFGAATFIYRDKDVYVAIRGTDGSSVGWKENLNLLYLDKTPSQILTQKYIEENIPAHVGKNIFLMGHSKGGNQAVYALAYASKEIQDAVSYVFNFDGPGFNKYFYELDEYKRIENKITKYMPQTSIIGRILYNGEYTVIKANATLFFQHMTYSWEVNGDKFTRMDRLDDLSNDLEAMIQNQISVISTEDRKKIVDAFFVVIEASGAKYFCDILLVRKNLLKCFKAFLNIERKTRKPMVKVFKKIARITIKRRKVMKLNKQYKIEAQAPRCFPKIAQ